MCPPRYPLPTASRCSVIDVIKLREYAVHGIPQEVRGHVWLYLLGVLSPEKSINEKRKKELQASNAHVITTKPFFSNWRQKS